MIDHAGRVTKNAPRRWTSSTGSSWSTVISPNGTLRQTPALCTTASTVPKCVTARSMIAAPPSGVATVSYDATARPPAASISATTTSAVGPSAAASSRPPTPLTTPPPPPRASSSAYARPSPCPAPVITTTCPSNVIGMVPRFSVSRHVRVDHRRAELVERPRQLAHRRGGDHGKALVLVTRGQRHRGGHRVGDHRRRHQSRVTPQAPAGPVLARLAQTPA